MIPKYLDVNLMKAVVNALDDLQHCLHAFLQLKLSIDGGGEGVGQILQQQLVLGQPLHRLQQIRAEGQLVAQVFLAAEEDGMIVTNISQS